MTFFYASIDLSVLEKKIEMTLQIPQVFACLLFGQDIILEESVLCKECCLRWPGSQHFKKYVSKDTWINFLFHELPLLFPYPSKDLVERLLPVESKSYPSTRIILDCTEIFIEVPSSMTAQSQTWSEYKHHNTWKALIGISPNGAITFVSKLWSGRVSDKEITRLSGVLSLLEPGDNVMADRGFIIADILPQGVTLNIPPFKGSRE